MSQVNNSKIAKNTILLYFRTILIMLITLYTSRVILNELGVKDYGIYNVVGGVVAMFSVVSSALSSSISRFITIEIGRENGKRLNVIFSTSVNIQIGIAILILLLGEVLGVWLLNYRMDIPQERLLAANWVLQCSLFMFCINLVSVPYNACIIAYEKMSAFAYISILEVSLKLLICYLLIFSGIDKLVTYAVLMVCVSILIRVVYGIYCSRNFKECHYRFVYDKSLFKEMTTFAGWSFFTNMAWIFNTQGVNLLINVFFGVTLNAARGIASQVEGAVMQFVNNFTTAVSPQITKSYAVGEYNQMFTLICRGAKFSYLLLLLIALPLLLETEFILSLWLKVVPDYTVTFVQLSIVSAMVNIIGNTGYTACMATGNIKKYVIWLTTCGFLVFPLTWISFKLGFDAKYAYLIYICVYLLIDVLRLILMKQLLHFPPLLFVREVLKPIVRTTIIACIVPYLVSTSMDPSFFRMSLTFMVSLVSVSLISCILGLTKNERDVIIKNMINKFIKHK